MNILFHDAHYFQYNAIVAVDTGTHYLIINTKIYVGFKLLWIAPTQIMWMFCPIISVVHTN